MIKVAIVDDEELLVDLLSDFFNRSGKVDVVCKAHSGKEFLDQLAVADEYPQVAFVDMRMQQMNGVETLDVMRQAYPQIKTIMMSSHYKKNLTGFMLKYGVSAFIPKGISPDELIKIAEIVVDKGFYFMPEQVNALRKQISNNVPQPVFSTSDALTKRELEVLDYICKQKTTKEISSLMNISLSTVEGHRAGLMQKTGVKNSAGLVIFAVKNNLINIDEIILP